MKTLKNILTATALLVTTQFGFAQSMKAPVSYQLKNGMTVIVAENSGTQKVFSNLSFEGEQQYTPENATVKEVLNTILTQQLPALNQGLSFTDKGINLATTAEQFENAMAAMYTYVSAPDFTAEALNKAKAEVLAHIAAQNKYYPESVTAAAVKKLDLAQVKAYYTQIANPATAYLTVAGNINASVIKAYAKKAFDRAKTVDGHSEVYLVSNL